MSEVKIRMFKCTSEVTRKYKTRNKNVRRKRIVVVSWNNQGEYTEMVQAQMDEEREIGSYENGYENKRWRKKMKKKT